MTPVKTPRVKAQKIKVADLEEFCDQIFEKAVQLRAQVDQIKKHAKKHQRKTVKIHGLPSLVEATRRLNGTLNSFEYDLQNADKNSP